MTQPKDPKTPRSGLTRRSFLKKSSLAPLAGIVGAGSEPLSSPRPRSVDSVQDEPFSVALVGFGPWGREIAATLDRMPQARLAAVCDSYEVMLRRAERSHPDASRMSDVAELLETDVSAVIVATPTHQHRDIVVAALEAGKHVYCEAPLASSIEDARAIARAAMDHPDLIFQSGLQYRSDPQHRNIFQFIRSGAVGTPTMARAQWNAKESWRRASPSPERERELNWRLDETVSAGLLGEVGIHQVDTAGWILRERPSAVTGFGEVVLWRDGRTVPDTVQVVFEFPSGVRMLYAATLTSSFDGAYDMFYGSDSTIMLRDSKGWMFKEVDAPLLGWEVYARKDTFYREKGIALVANATKLEAQGLDPAADDPNVETPIYYGLEAFFDNLAFGPYEAIA
ncbi:MAG: Gfo/Idh/MocA family oxidoreductase, partial [Rhodothermales bacterium]|nr:Gfo/Idh/MocA family oxidoreductase [Rhodothermales bacterium]